MAACYKCKKQGAQPLSYTMNSYCPSCLEYLLGERILREIRRNNIALFGAKFRLQKGQKERYNIAKKLLLVLETKGAKLGKSGRMLSTDTLDIIAQDFLASWFVKKPVKKTNAIYPLKSILDEELNILAKAWKLPQIPEAKTPIARFYKDLCKKHPQNPFGLIKSIEALQ